MCGQQLGSILTQREVHAPRCRPWGWKIGRTEKELGQIHDIYIYNYYIYIYLKYTYIFDMCLYSYIYVYHIDLCILFLFCEVIFFGTLVFTFLACICAELRCRPQFYR